MIRNFLLGTAIVAISLTGTYVAVKLEVQAQEIEYKPLATIPGAFEKEVPTNPIKIITNIYGVAIGIAAILAVVMIIWAGIEYATTEAISGKSGAKEKWQGALWGLGLLLASYLILRTINVDLVDIRLDLQQPIVSSNKVSSDTLMNLVERTAKDAKSAIQNVENIQANAKTAEEGLNDRLAEFDAKLNSATTSAAEKSDILAQRQLAEVFLEFRKRDQILTEEVLEANKNLERGIVSLGSLRIALEEEKKYLEDSLKTIGASDSKVHNALELRLKSLEAKFGAHKAVNTTLIRQHEVYTRGVSIYLNAKPSSNNVTGAQFEKELLAKELFFEGEKNTPLNFLRLIEQKRGTSDPLFSSILKTMNVFATSRIDRAIKVRISCYESFKKNPSGLSSDCNPF